MREWCEATQCEPWQPSELVNLTIDAQEFGLRFTGEGRQELLQVIGDLGLQPSPELNERLLMLNADLDNRDGGTYAVHPEQPLVVYRLHIPLSTQVDGADLPQFIASRFDEARFRVLA
ncbi:MAG: hypothetical protein KF871_10400 [Hydrogenophaga sp.]|uniref:hypothetical protein n=1 Tax=Hydrogenophaga sp. TaxID=1904254 RepID=UPI001E0F8813|nr:hypothetical protein [Hydrogenophaga sp.]MBX3610295.1 hypothetical protein [Hydrogenophaga sp.]